jgi:glycosyltransferase involved in cell wall biosynthesis
MKMNISRKEAEGKYNRITLLWVSTSVMDVFLHNNALLAVLKKLTELGYKINLVAIRSNKIKTKRSSFSTTLVPLKFLPIFSPVLFTIAMMLFMPVLILRSNANFVVFDPDIHILSFFPSMFVCKARKIKTVLDIRTVPVEIIGIRGWFRKFWFATSILIAKKLFDGITIITPLMRDQISKEFDLNPNNIGVWTSGVSEDLFDPKDFSSNRSELKKELGLTDQFVVFYHGVFTPTRGLLETINAMELLLQSHEDLALVLLGSGPFKSTLDSFVQGHHLENKIIIHDPVNQQEVPKFISACDVGIVPLPDHAYWRFQSPLKLLEYLAMEKSVILTDIPAHRYVLGGADCGIYVSSIDPKKIAEAIEYAYCNKSNLLQWGIVGREIIKQKFTWEKVAKDFEQYLLSLQID